jgi:hypothetical protein
VKKAVLLMLFCFSYVLGWGQIAYQSRYTSAFYIEGLGMGPFFSLGVEHAPKKRLKSFVAYRTGVGVILGPKKTIGARDIGFTLPMSITKTLVMNNLKKRVKMRVSLRCNAQPPKIATEWFSEVGLGYTPAYYNKNDIRHKFYGLVGFRQQLVINIPPRPKVFYVKVQYTPYFTTFNYKGFGRAFKLLPTSQEDIIVGASLGFSFK